MTSITDLETHLKGYMTSITHLETHLKGYITSITHLEGMQTHLKGVHDLNYSSRDSSKGVHYLNYSSRGDADSSKGGT